MGYYYHYYFAGKIYDLLSLSSFLLLSDRSFALVPTLGQEEPNQHGTSKSLAYLCFGREPMKATVVAIPSSFRIVSNF